MDITTARMPAHISVPTERVVCCPWHGQVDLERCERCPYLLWTLDDPEPVILCAYGHATPFHRPGFPTAWTPLSSQRADGALGRFAARLRRRFATHHIGGR